MHDDALDHAASTDLVPSVGRTRLSRRKLIGIGAAAGVTVAAGGIAADRAFAATPATVTSLTSHKPFYIAHRGGGRDWPELTAYAYQQATALSGLQAIELSVCITKDKVLVLSHDPTTLAATGQNYAIADSTWSQLSSLQVSAKNTLNPSQASRPITRYSEVIYRYLANYVVFVEPKVSAAIPNLWYNLHEMAQPSRVVWKEPINSSRFADAKKEGWGTWGYVLNEPWLIGDNLKRYAASSSIDMLGAPLSESDDFIASVVAAAKANGKKTIAWAASTAAQRDRALKLGCDGIMASEIKGLLNTGLGAALNS